jgi:hypothetical protein
MQSVLVPLHSKKKIYNKAISTIAFKSLSAASRPSRTSCAFAWSTHCTSKALAVEEWHNQSFIALHQPGKKIFFKK